MLAWMFGLEVRSTSIAPFSQDQGLLPVVDRYISVVPVPIATMAPPTRDLSMICICPPVKVITTPLGEVAFLLLRSGRRIPNHAHLVL
jgi:hypothetical protein